MQDMSGYVLADTTLPLLDEQLDLTNSTAQTENDFYVQHPGPSSPVEFILGDTPESMISDDSAMFGNSNFDMLDVIPNECQLESHVKRNPYEYMQSDETRTITNMGEEENHTTSKVSSCRPKAKLTINKTNRTPKYLALIDSEEPLIKEEPDMLYCTQNKMDMDSTPNVNLSISTQEQSFNLDTSDIYILPDMEVAEEVVVMTEEEDKYNTNLNTPIFDYLPTVPEDDIYIPVEKPKSGVIFQLDPISFETVMGDLDLFNNLDTADDDDLYSRIKDEMVPITPEAIEEDYKHLDMFSSNNQPVNSYRTPVAPSPTTSRKPSKPVMKKPPLTLDIGAAKAICLDHKGITDTPELMAALKPEIGEFDLIKFITTNGDPNNNGDSPTTETRTSQPSAPRKGKSHLSLLDLKEAQRHGRRRPFSQTDNEREENEPLPSTSSASSLKRPARQSATRFKKMIEEGFLGSVTQSASSDEEEDEPKTKRRRTTSSTSSRRRLNSDSDHSSINEDAMKYRERRDRNNLSSKRSRQKRKMHYIEKQKELKELEAKNSHLKRTEKDLKSALTKLKSALADFLAHMKDNKDRGDEH